MIGKVKKEIQNKLKSVDNKLLGGVADFDAYNKLQGRHEAFTDALTIIDEYGNLDEDD